MPKTKDITEKAIALPPEVNQLVQIKSQEDLTEATKLLSFLNRTLDDLTEQKEKLTKPINAALKEIRSRYKLPESILEQKIGEIRQEMTSYQTKQVALQQKKEEKITDQLASGKISIEKATQKVENLPTVSKKTETDEGLVQFKPVEKFEVISLKDLPIEYHVANETAVRKAMQEGNKLPGVKYWIEQVPYNSR